MSVSKEEAQPNYITWEEYQRSISYLKEDVRNLRKKVRLLVRILVDKKIVGEEVAKSIEESLKERNDPVLDWFLKGLEKPKGDK